MPCMDCPVCNWPLKHRLQWVTHGYACAIWRCESCESDITAKTPESKFRNFIPTEAADLTISEQEQCLSILSAIRATLADARPSALKAQLEEVLNDGE